MSKQGQSQQKKPTGKIRAGFGVSAAVSLDPNDPIPVSFNRSNLYRVSNSQTNVVFLNDHNFFNVLLEAAMLSPTQNRCIEKVVEFTIGDGWHASLLPEGGKVDKDFEDWQKRVSNRGLSLNELIELATSNLVSQGNAFVEVIVTDVDGAKSLRTHLHLCSECQVIIDEFGDPVKIGISQTLNTKVSNTMGAFNAEIPIFDPFDIENSFYEKTNEETKVKTRHTILHLKTMKAGIEYYGVPKSMSSLIFQSQEYEMAAYNVDTLKNNMVAGALLVISGSMNEAERRKLAIEMNRAYSGRGRRGRTVVIAGDGQINDAKFNQIDNKKEGSFIEADKHNEKKIITSHGLHPALLGIQEGGSLGNGNDYILSLFAMAYKSTISPIQKKLIQGLIEPIVQISDSMLGTQWARYGLSLVTNPPVSMLTNDQAINAWTVDEVRKEAGLPPLEGEKGKALFGELGKQGADQGTNKKDQNVPGK